MIDVGQLLTVDLDTHKVFVQNIRYTLLLKGVGLHNVAPITGRISDRKKDRFILAFCARKGLLTPWVPPDRVILVL